MATTTTVPEYQTSAQACQTLGLTLPEIKTLVLSGQLPVYEVQGAPRFKPADLAACKRALYVACFDPCALAS